MNFRNNDNHQGVNYLGNYNNPHENCNKYKNSSHNTSFNYPRCPKKSLTLIWSLIIQKKKLPE